MIPFLLGTVFALTCPGRLAQIPVELADLFELLIRLNGRDVCLPDPTCGFDVASQSFQTDLAFDEGRAGGKPTARKADEPARPGITGVRITAPNAGKPVSVVSRLIEFLAKGSAQPPLVVRINLLGGGSSTDEK